MAKLVCSSCHEELRYATWRRMMCFNKTCEKIYAMDYECAACSAKKQVKVLMEVVAPGEVRCPLCGNKRKAPELNLETMMRDETIARMGGRGQTPRRSIIPQRTSTGPGRAVSGIGAGRVIRQQTDYTTESIFMKPRTVGKKEPSSSRQFSAFPERTELYVEETGRDLTIIIEFPRHTLEQIQWRKEDAELIVESGIVTCSYRDEIALPEWAAAIEPEVKFSNGFLTIKFTKNCPLSGDRRKTAKKRKI